MAGRVDPRTLEQWREAFSCYAEPHLAPGQGSITTRDLGQLMRALGKNPTEDELSKLFKRVDPQQEGAIKFDTFCQCMMEPTKNPESENEILEAFRAFDYQNSGTIQSSEFQTVMRNYGEALSDEEVDDILKVAASCEVGPGVIDYRRLTKLMCQ
jgi:calmodulin